MMVVRKLKLGLIASLCGMIGALAFTGGSAFGAYIHPFASSFGSFTNDVQGVTVDQATGDVYVYDAGAEAIYKFNSSGAPAIFSSTGTNTITGVPGAGHAEGEIAVDGSNGPAAGDIYLAHASYGNVLIYSEAGTQIGELKQETGKPWGEACGVAVDPSGNVYVGLAASGDASHVNKYTPSANPVTDADYVSSLSGLTGEVCNIAADSAESVYADTWSAGPVTKYQFSPLEMSAIGTVVSNSGSTLAVDPSSDTLLIDTGAAVSEYAASGASNGAPFGASGSGALNGSSFGVAVNGKTHTAYVSDGVGHISVFNALVVPDVITGAASSVNGVTTAVTLEGTVNPDNEALVECKFEYGETQAYGQQVPCESIPSGSAPVTVTAKISGLAGKIYHYRLSAADSNGVNHGEDRILALRPTIEEASVFDVAATSATLQARIRPGFLDTSYRFEYGPSGAYGQSAPVPAGDAGAGESGTTVTVHVQGLSPGVEYHYRIVASNALSTVASEDQTFTTQPAESEFELPDGRAYELVSPPDKNGAQIGRGFVEPYEGGTVVQASEDGAAIAYMANGPVGEDQQGDVAGTQVYSTRSATGWSSRDIVTPRSKGDNGVVAGVGEEYKLFSSDLSTGLVEPYNTAQLSPEAPPGEKNLYRWNAGDDSYTPLIKTPPSTPFSFELTGASPDLSHVVFLSHQALTPNALNAESSEYPNLYEWAGGKLQLINVLPASEGDRATAGNASLGGPYNFTDGSNIRSAVSVDGSHVVWTDAENENIYVRDTVTEQTTLVGAGVFEEANSDDSRIVFAHKGGEGYDLYEYDAETGEQADLTTGDAEVKGVLGSSTDGSSVYFVAKGELASGARPGADNLYLAREDGTSWVTTYISTLAPGDYPDWGEEINPRLPELTSQVSPDGRFVAFMSSASLTGYDNRDAVSGEPDVEVYLYDSAGSGRLVCASCNPSGARPVGEFDEDELPMDEWGAWHGQWLAAAVRGWTSVDNGLALYQSRYLFDSGRLFFGSSDALAPHDTNGREDVYEFEPPGVGNCSSLSVAFHQGTDGCVSLISAGTGSADSKFMDASATGDDVFFITRDRLVPRDFDDSYDMYDAHVCSAAAPCQPAEAVSPPPCGTGDACKPAPSPQPAIFGDPASATFSGVGNVAQPASAGLSVKKPKKRRARRRPRRRRGAGAGHGSRGTRMGHKR